MKTQITIALLALSLLGGITQPTQAFDLGIGSKGSGFPTDIGDDDSPDWNPQGGTITFSQPAIKKGMTIPGNDDTTLIDGHGIDVSQQPVPYVQVGGEGLVMDGTGALAAICQVAGTPSEFPDDIRVTNIGDRTIPAGALISWRTAGPRMAGTARLASPLRPGNSASLSNALPGGADPQTGCQIRAIQT